MKYENKDERRNDRYNTDIEIMFYAEGMTAYKIHKLLNKYAPECISLSTVYAKVKRLKTLVKI